MNIERFVFNWEKILSKHKQVDQGMKIFTLSFVFSMLIKKSKVFY